MENHAILFKTLKAFSPQNGYCINVVIDTYKSSEKLLNLMTLIKHERNNCRNYIKIVLY